MGALARIEDARSDEREKIFHRTRLRVVDGSTMAATLVDISRGGFMIRTDATVAADDRLVVELPVAGSVVATVRWALGGRIGCQLESPIAEISYPALLAALRRA